MFAKFSVVGRDIFSKRVPVSNAGKQTTSKVSGTKQQSFYYAHDLCGSRIQIGHNEDGLSGAPGYLGDIAEGDLNGWGLEHLEL